ncbi:MAG: hypothetical protein HUU43_16280 [Ignavibacteriaceae bacterium]|nr:hypothetical protein [Ignavibacteriaceae bacterium]
MKKTVISLLILLLIFNAGGYLFIYWQMQQAFKKAGLRKIAAQWDDSQLVKITMRGDYTSEGEYITWVKPHEIRVNGSLFDIVRKKAQGSDTVLYCISDKDEDALEAAFISGIEKNKDNGKGNALKNLLSILNLTGVVEGNFILKDYRKPDNIFTLYTEVETYPIKEITSPPPDLI